MDSREIELLDHMSEVINRAESMGGFRGDQQRMFDAYCNVFRCLRKNSSEIYPSHEKRLKRWREMYERESDREEYVLSCLAGDSRGLEAQKAFYRYAKVCRALLKRFYDA